MSVPLAKPSPFSICSQIGAHIKHRVQELGHGCSALVTKAGALQCSPSDDYTKKELIECARRVSEKVTALIHANWGLAFPSPLLCAFSQ